MKANNSKALAFIFTTVLLDMMGLGIIIPVIPDLIMELTGSSESDGAIKGGVLQMAYAIMMFLAAPKRSQKPAMK